VHDSNVNSSIKGFVMQRPRVVLCCCHEILILPKKNSRNKNDVLRRIRGGTARHMKNINPAQGDPAPPHGSCCMGTNY
jgi:hypothetical protein